MDGLLVNPPRHHHDSNDDGVIHGLSFDWTAFDIASTLDAVAGFSEARTVDEFESRPVAL